MVSHLSFGFEPLLADRLAKFASLVEIPEIALRVELLDQLQAC